MKILNILRNKEEITYSYFIIIIFASFLWISIFLIFPNSKTPDETAHYKVVQTLADFKWPILSQNPVKSLNPNSDLTVFSAQAYHPPLYYLTASAFYKTASLFNLNGIEQYKFTKLSSFTFFIITIYFIHKALMIYFSVKSSTFLTLATTTQPTFLAMSIAINPDIGAIALATIFFYYLLKILGEGNFTYIKILLFAFLTAIAILFKFSNIILVPIFIFSSIILGLHKVKESVGKLLVYFAVIIMVLSPWFTVNYLIYRELIVDNFHLTYIDPEYSHTLFTLGRDVIMDLMLATYNLSGNPWFYQQAPQIIRNVYLIVLLTMILIGFYYIFKKRSSLKELGAVVATSFATAFMFFSIFSLEIIFFYNHYALYGRYFLILLIPIVLTIAFALTYINKEKIRHLSLLLFLFGLLNLLLNAYFLLTLETI